jgi:Zn ribbon nucleic-acid-binding protein
MTPRRYFLGRQRSVPTSACTACGKQMNAASAMNNEARPKPGHVSICINCGHIMAFAKDMRLRDLTGEEVIAVAGDPEIIALQKARAAVMGKKKG